MSVTITSSTGATSTPATIMPVRLAAPGRAKLHPIIGESAPDITYAPAQLRRGELEYLYPDEASAAEAFAMHTAGVWFDVEVISDPLNLEMRYVVPDAADMRIEQQQGNRKRMLIVAIQEIPS